MKEIKLLVKDIENELEGAEHCAKLAIQYKDEDHLLAEAYAKIAHIKLEQISGTMHDQAERLIKAKKAAGIEAPASMQAVYDWEHEKMIDTVARIKTILAMYKG